MKYFSKTLKRIASVCVGGTDIPVLTLNKPMFYFDTWCEKYIAELFPGFARHITSQNAVRFIRRITVDGGPNRVNQEFRITLSPEVLQALHRATTAQAAEIGRHAYEYLHREISARMPLDERDETPLAFYLDEEILT